ncbi:MAG: YggT family protein [Gammaproteobacteria bacterium]|nr:YggT family protein [Gammaproteobacteria bacterium]MCY4227033.1 YggT family protein [Gammaproteobacteria bacterium]
MPYIQNSLGFLVETVLGLYVLVILLRLVFQYCGADHRNPLSVLIIRFTEAPLGVFRKIIPRMFGVDMACFVFALAVSMIQLALVIGVSGYSLNIAAIALLALSDILSTLVWIVIIAILAAAIMSWFMRSYHPVLFLAVQISQPVLRPIRHIMPTIGGLDLSPIVAFFMLNLILRLVVAPIGDFGRLLMLG